MTDFKCFPDHQIFEGKEQLLEHHSGDPLVGIMGVRRLFSKAVPGVGRQKHAICLKNA